MARRNRSATQLGGMHSPPPPFNAGTDNWILYVDQFEMFLESNEMAGISEKRKRATFLACCGPAVFEMAKALAAPQDVKKMNWSDLEKILRAHYAPTVSNLIWRSEFYTTNQMEGETFGEFVAKLRSLAGKCGFCHIEEFMRDRAVLGMKDSTLKGQLLLKPDITLNEVIEKATAAEANQKTAIIAKKLNRPVPEVTAEKNPTTHYGYQDSETEESDEDDGINQLQSVRGERNKLQRREEARCPGCNGRHRRADCRFREAICDYCGKKGHIARACRNRRQPSPNQRSKTFSGRPADDRNRGRWMTTDKSRKDRERTGPREWTHQTVSVSHAEGKRTRKMRVQVTIEGQQCNMEIDSGSYLSMVSWKTLKQLIPSITKAELQHQTATLRDYQGNQIPVMGIRRVQVQFKDRKATLPLTVVSRDRPSLLGIEWFEPLGIGITGIHAIEEGDWEQDLMEEFRVVFDGELGKYQGAPLSFNIDPKVTPIRLKPRRVPFTLRPKIDEQLDKLIAQGVLEPIDHAKWETPIVTPVKPDGSVRICGDYKGTLNHALQQSAYPVPVVHHLLHSLGKGKIFAKLDLAQAYQQLPVDKETAEAQTIVTHRGAFKCNRLQFGVSVAPGIFQSLMERLLQGIPGVVPYFDDVLISARDKDQLKERLREVLTKFRQAGLKVKKDKCTLATREVEFLGFKIDDKGIHPTRGKIKAIQDAPKPRNKTELQAFLGLINFYHMFLPQKATIAEPLHRLLDKKATWVWENKEDTAFAQIKRLITSDCVLLQYSTTMPITLTCDASPYGVGAVLSHELPNGREAPIAFHSRTLNTTERNYSQLDKEALAIVTAVKKFHEYLYGRSFKIITDHKPLLGILAGDKITPNILSPRMTRWSEFLAAYNYKLIHRPGKQITNADALSRCPLRSEERDPAPTEFVLQTETFQKLPVNASDIAQETTRERTLAKVMDWVKRGWPEDRLDDLMKPFKNRQTELSTLKGCLLWGDRVVIPTKLRKLVLKMLHETHPGIVKMKSLARSHVWWPGIDKEIENWVATCKDCQETRPAPPAAPKTQWEQARGPWSRVHIDFAGPNRGYTYLIVVDAYSGWLEIAIMQTTTTHAVITQLRRLFATHGLPDVLVSDNGPQFTAIQFENYLTQQGIRHALTSPAHPQGNGKAERMVRFMKEKLKQLGPGEMQEKIDRILTIQHITPRATTNKSPAELLMGRKLRSPLDRLNPTYNSEKPLDSSTKTRSFNVGDQVYAKNLVGDPPWIPAKITQVTGPRSYRIETCTGIHWKRHIDQLRSRTLQTPEEYETQEQHTTKTKGEGGDPSFNQGGGGDPPQNIVTHKQKDTRNQATNTEKNSGNVPLLTPEGQQGGRDTHGERPAGSGGADSTLLASSRGRDGDKRSTSTQLGNPKTTELRKPSRAHSSPTYLRDYVR